MDSVRIEQLQTQAVIGVHPSERTAPQPLMIDLVLTTDFSQVFTSDNLKDALDYEVISQQVRAFCEQSNYQLVEALAGGIINLIFKQWAAHKVAVGIRKPNALTGALASIWCERTRAQ